MLRIWVVSRYGTEGGAVINLFHLLLRNGIKSEYVKGGGYGVKKGLHLWCIGRL